MAVEIGKMKSDSFLCDVLIRLSSSRIVESPIVSVAVSRIARFTQDARDLSNVFK